MSCQVCGSYSGVFPICKKCNSLKEQGKVVKCDECGTWHYANKPCPECANAIPLFPERKKSGKKTQKEDYIDFEDELTCITCGMPSNGKHFCLSCYKKFSNKVLYLKVQKCKDFDKLEAEYESDFVCDDGHLVKSPYEKIIDNWLYKEGIQHAYEIKIDIDENKDLTPDFYIPEYNGRKNIYIEFWGYDESNIKYQRIKEYKLKVYPELVKRDSITVIYPYVFVRSVVIRITNQLTCLIVYSCLLF